MPVWHKLTAEWVKQGKLVVLGVAQEQHPDRMKLFLQWHQVDWPMMIDPINLTGVTGVFRALAIDEHGVVRVVSPEPDRFFDEFVNKSFAPPASMPDIGSNDPPDLKALQDKAAAGKSAPAWRDLADGLYLWGPPERITEAIEAYQRTIKLDPRDQAAQFRLGVCYRSRYDSPRARRGDFQSAVRHWERSVQMNPNQYIWRRRIQQYGPRLDKPYPFYDWVARARSDIRARGQQPVPLTIEPYGSELAGKAARMRDQPVAGLSEPDAEGRIIRDTKPFVTVEPTVVPSTIKPGQTVHVHMVFRLDQAARVHWENQAGPLSVWVNLPPGWTVDRRLIQVSNEKAAQSAEVRLVDFELGVPDDAAEGLVSLAAYAVYFVCEDVGGTCRLLRQDLTLPLEVRRD